MSARRSDINIDDDGPWTAACYLRSDTAFTGEQHGLSQGGTLCGLDAEAIAVVRNPFYGKGAKDCTSCGERLRSLTT